MKQFVFVNPEWAEPKGFIVKAPGFIPARIKFWHYLQENVDAKIKLRDVFNEWTLIEVEEVR